MSEKWTPPMASFLRRALAYFVDSFLISLLWVPIFFPMFRQAVRTHSICLHWPLLSCLVILPIIYRTSFLMWAGATPGKILLRIRVVSVHGGGSLTFMQALIRSLCHSLSFFFSFFPQVVAFFRRDRRQFADLLAETVVIHPFEVPRAKPIRWGMGMIIIFISVINCVQIARTYPRSFALQRCGLTVQFR